MGTNGIRGKAGLMASLSKKDLEYIKSISGKLAPKKDTDRPTFNSSGDEGLEDLGVLQEPDEVAQGPTLENFNGAVPDDGGDVPDSILRHDKTTLLSERALSYDPRPETHDDGHASRTHTGMRVRSLIARLSESERNPECLASIDGMMMRIESVSSDDYGRPVIILSER